MPTYEYKCKACGHKFEKFHSIMAAPIKKCPECGKNAVERLISAGAGLIFKGSGFYITDYRDAAYSDKAKADTAAATATPAAATDGSAKESKADSKSEAKADSKGESKPATEAKPAAPAAKSDSKRLAKSAKIKS